MQAASIWSFLRELISCTVQPAHTTHEYSIIGSKYDKYIWFKATRLNVNLSFRIIPITLDAFLIMFSIWQCHCPLLLNVRPKCLCSVTNFMGVPSKIMSGRDSINLIVKSITSVFKGLKFINHYAVQFTSMRKSWLIIPSMSLIVAAELNNELSSANNLVRLRSDSAISLIYTKNNRGPRTEPWGTPASTLLKLDEVFLMTTFCFLPLK